MPTRRLPTGLLSHSETSSVLRRYQVPPPFSEPRLTAFRLLSTAQLLSPTVSSTLHPGKSLQGKLLVKDLASRFPSEARLTSIAEEINRIAI